MRAVAGALGAAAALTVGLIAGGGTASHRHPETQPVQATTATQVASTPNPLPTQPPSDRGQLAADLGRAQQIIDDPSSTSEMLSSAGRFEQLATVYLLNRHPQAQRGTLALLGARAARTMRANLAAASVLSHLVTPRKRLPPWRVVQPPAPGALLAYFKTAQARFGVRWEYLAAIEFIETKFGRVHGVSTAGAQGPMQFLPSTWARYGRGNIEDPHDAILAAARYLRANGAPGDMAGALYHYNPSSEYVAAVNAYAGAMRADSRDFYGYYEWQVLYAYARGDVILPVGYPKRRPAPALAPAPAQG